MTAPGTPPLSPTGRTTVRRGRIRAVEEREALYDVLSTALVCHLGVIVGEGIEAHPVVLPTVCAVDVDGPDDGGTLYLHGSVAARSLVAAPDRTICVTATVLDGIVAARSAFHHSMNYRSAVVIGRPRVVTDETERAHALELLVDHVVPGRAAMMRPHTRKELAATVVLALPLHEASVKVRAGGPGDDPDDIEAGTWGGHIPLRLVADPAVPAPECQDQPVPDEVRALVDRLAP